MFGRSLSGCPLVLPSEKKILMRQEAEEKLLAQVHGRQETTIKLRSGKGKLSKCLYQHLLLKNPIRFYMMYLKSTLSGTYNHSHSYSSSFFIEILKNLFIL